MDERRLSDFEVIVRLSTRQSGGLFLARRRGLERFSRLFCLKTFLSSQVADEEQLDSFLREARIVTKLQHPNCVRVFEVDVDGETSFFAMEHVFGETLRFILDDARASRRPVPWPVVVGIATAIADGLHHAHELGIVHRDVTPENVMVAYEDGVKVLDFGIAKIADAIATRTGLIKGKAAYMSPEQITGQRVDRRSDLFALGIILHEAFGNHRLFGALTPKDIVYRLHKEPPAPIRDLVKELPTALAAITDRALAFDPAKRFADAAAMADALRPHATADLGEFLRTRFGERFETRRRVLDECRRGAHDDEELLRVLEARPMTALDFIGSGLDDAPPTTVRAEWQGDVAAVQTERAVLEDFDQEPDPDFEASIETYKAERDALLPNAEIETELEPHSEATPPPSTRNERGLVPPPPTANDTAPMGPVATPGSSTAVAARRLEALADRPSSVDPKRLLIIALGLGFGVALGIGGSVYLLDLFGK